MENQLIIKKLNSISITDGEQFNYIVNVINGCFGRDYKSIYSCMNMTYCHIDDEHMVWFPKMVTLKNGIWKSPSRAQGWLNYLSNDGKVFIEEKTDDVRIISNKGDDILPRYTFGWFKNKGYVFLGVFVADIKKCHPGHFEYIRIADKIDLRKYHTTSMGIKLPTPNIIHENEAADDAYVNVLRHSNLSDIQQHFEYISKPKEIKEPIIKNGIKVYPRDRITAINALTHANFCCEINSKHTTFIRKNSDKKYTEPHHLIPMAF